MSQFRHLLVFSLIFAIYHFTKSEDVPKSAEPDTAAKFSFNNAIINGSWTLKISMEKAQCVNDRVPVPPAPEGLIAPESGTKVLGSRTNPAKSCSDLEEPDNSTKYYISTSTNPIIVACNDKFKTTCLIVKDRIQEESALNSTAITLGEELWLSQTTFDVESLYKKVEDPTVDILQISHLLSTSVKVFQTIKYYYSEGNSTTVNDTNVTSLKALLWNDHLVGSTITKQMPFAFSANETKPCWEGEENTEGWMCTTIHFDATSTNRLPVRDFYIQDIRKREKVQKLYFELVELCFYY